MRSINKVMVLGNLTKDPEFKEFDSGKRCAKFSVATNRNWLNKDGEKQTHTDFHNVIAWEKLAEICRDYLKKGAPVLLEGRLSNSSFEKEGRKFHRTEIFVDQLNLISYQKKADQEEINIVEVDA